MAKRKNGHLVREPAPIVVAPAALEVQPDPRQLQLELAPARARFVALDVEGDEQSVAAALQLAGALIGGRHG